MNLDRRRLPSYALAAALALTGVTCLVLALTHQRHASAVPMSVAPSAAAVVASVPPRPSPVRGTAVAAPTAIAIRRIGVSTPLLTLGQAADGSIAPPSPGPHYDEAGWYRYSPRPGAIGPAVIVGHVDSKSGGPSVFFRLGELRRGDLIEIARADRSTAVFVVDDVRRFAKAHFPTQLVYGDTDHAALRLITCGGAFDHGSGHYLDNVVVSASLRPA